MKNPNIFVTHLYCQYIKKKNWNNIKEIGKQEEIAKNIEYIKRLAYKMNILFSFNEKLLQAIAISAWIKKVSILIVENGFQKDIKT